MQEDPSYISRQIIWSTEKIIAVVILKQYLTLEYITETKNYIILIVRYIERSKRNIITNVILSLKYYVRTFVVKCYITVKYYVKTFVVEVLYIL